MKYFIVFLIATVVVSQTEAAPLDGLHGMGNAVNKTVEFLKTFKVSFAVNADKRLAAYHENQKHKVVATVNKTLEEVHEKAEESGKNVEHCMKDVQSELNSTQAKVLPELDRCVKENKPDWSVHDEDFDAMIAEGQELLEKIEQIEEDCQSKGPWLTQLCVVTKLPEVGLSLGLYKRAVGEFKGALSVSFQLAVATVGKCMEVPLMNFQHDVKNVQKGVLECIETAQY